VTVAATTVPSRRPLGDRIGRFLDRHLIRLYAILAVLYLLLPIAVIALFSFNDPAGRTNFAWRGFTLQYWMNPLGVPGLGDAVAASLRIAFGSMVVSTILGTLIALALVRYQFRGVTGMNMLIFLPLATPEIVLGASLLTLFVAYGQPPLFPLSETTILIAHIMFNISFVVVTVRARLAGSAATSRRRRWTSGPTSGRRSGRSHSRSSCQASSPPPCSRSACPSTTSSSPTSRPDEP
jgi:spermidine/putrescine transport system permease protein